MECNIDRRGRQVRLAWGVLMLLLAGVAAALGITQVIGAAWAWGAGIVLSLLGILGFYEARKGWCAVRAMGYKTPV